MKQLHQVSYFILISLFFISMKYASNCGFMGGLMIIISYNLL